MLHWQEIEQAILANGRVDGPTLEGLCRELSAGGKINRQKAAFLVELHKRVQHLPPAFEQLFFQAFQGAHAVTASESSFPSRVRALRGMGASLRACQQGVAMRAVWQMGLVLGIVVSLHGMARSQDEIRSFGGPVVLLRDHEVQEELQITRQQKTKLREDLTRVRERYKEEIARVRSMKPQEQESFRQTIQAELREITGQILSSEQIRRLEQIHLQTGGPLVFLEERVQRELRLGKEQKRKIEELVKDCKQREKEIADGEADRRDKRTQTQKLQRQTLSSIWAVLNEEQQQHWKEMIGEPFE